MAIPTGKVTLIDGDGQVITVLDVDQNGQATYTETLNAEDVGRRTVRAVYTGDSSFVPRGEDTFTMEVVDENGQGGANSKATHVIKIVAGPGIYISPKSGQGTVTISTQPVSDVGTGNFLRVRWTQTESTKLSTDLSFFLAGADNGALMSSDDGNNYTDMGPVNTLGQGGSTLAIDNITVIQSGSFDDNGLKYWNIVPFEIENSGAPFPDGLSFIWGALGRTDQNGVIKGDAMTQSGGHLQLNGQEVPNVQVDYAESFLLGSDILTIIFGTNGNIYSAGEYPDFTAGQNSDILRSEATGLTEVLDCKSDIEDAGTGSFTLKAVTIDGDILVSYRNGNSDSSWSVETSTGANLQGIAYGEGTWIAVGADDTIFIDGVESYTGIPANWIGIAYGGGKWVICGAGGALAISTDTGQTWTAADSGTTQNLNDVAYSPALNVFSAVGNNRSTVAIKGL